ncbi:hypothetical protein EHQ81_18105 [Leptospira selangorensis]|uniref:Lipoprotein n=1 Tax=Leptospira selangorensis TaxID=2484982 RepID=A0A5F2C4Q8_9LEPT|nr:hypothetical protein [Leptospira selangorensis]TGM10732.1 hypothetical protein EHQ81_18105 [Leptospira selangorensis]TGM26768.1 hypothetical protein EHQ82_01825 [Leptospira selangorensis]
MKSLNKKVSKAVSALAVAIALVGCDSGGGGSNAALALAGLGSSYQATVVMGGKLRIAAASTVFPSVGYVTNKPAFVKLTGSTLTSGGTDFTVGSSTASDAADFNITFKTNSATGKLHGEVFAISDAYYTSTVVPVGAKCSAGSACDSETVYTELVGSFDMNYAVDTSDPTNTAQLTFSNLTGDLSPSTVAGVSSTLYVDLANVITTVAGVYSNPNATVGEALCDSIGTPTIKQGTISGTQIWGKYTLLRGTVVVNNNATITIPKGAVIYGERGSSLFFNGANLVTQGTAAEPVCFTSAQARGSRFPGDWGGIVFIGNGNGTRTSGTTEGTTPLTYPGSNPSNLTLRYTIVEFAGNEVAPGDELNSLSQYQVNSATYRFVQAHRGLDDSFEWWGGGLSPSTFDGAYLIGSGAMDDDFDMDEGFSGTLKYLISVKYPAACGGSVSTDPHGFEMDGVHASSGFAGCAPGANSTHDCSNPTVSNYTAVGFNFANSFGERHREGLQGSFSQGILWNFSRNIVCDSTSGFPAVNSSISNVHSDNSKTDCMNSAACGATATGTAPTCAASLLDLSALPVTDLGSVQDGNFCGHGTKPDFTTSATVASGATGGAPVGGTTDSIVGSVTEKWWSGWAVWRAH